MVALTASDDSKTKGDPVKTSPEVLASKVCVFNMVNSALAELSNTSKESVGVFDVLFVTSIDLIIIVSSDPAVNKAVSLPVAMQLL